MSTTKEQEQSELHAKIWKIADALRGAVDGWDFKAYVIVAMFYRFLSENLTDYVNGIQEEYDPEEFLQVFDGKIVLDRNGTAGQLKQRVLDYIGSIPLKTGEESRFIKQLEYHFKKPVIRKIASSPISSGLVDSSGIEKTSEDIESIRKMSLSASSLKNYLDCPAMFYFGKVRHLLKDEEIAESMDDKTLGTVYHAVMQDLYTVDSKVVTSEYLVGVKKDKAKLQSLVRRHILENIPSDEVTGRDLVVEDVILKYVEKTLEKDIKYLKDNGFSFRIIGLEKV